MTQNVLDQLTERGFIAQASHSDEIRAYLDKPGGVAYVGFDPTADSLHVGHLMMMVVMAHLQKAGHRPIALLGGGTGMVGDPSDRTDMRRLLTPADIERNLASFREQMSILLDFAPGRAIVDNNARWLLDLNYVEFLREIGVHFSVNRMLTADAYRLRLERGLTFLEFNYMLMQAYDFLILFREYGCRLQLGGNDQWSNILAGVDLIRRKEQEAAFALTMNLLTMSGGAKMGKTVAGAVWLDARKTPPYDFYQFWRNIDDSLVEERLLRLTFLAVPQIRELCSVTGQALNEAKRVLAFELTKMVHGVKEAEEAEARAKALFSTGAADDMDTYRLSAEDLELPFADLAVKAGLAPSKSEARRLVQQGGFTVNDVPVKDALAPLAPSSFQAGQAIVRRGKKRFLKLLPLETPPG